MKARGKSNSRTVAGVVDLQDAQEGRECRLWKFGLALAIRASEKGESLMQRDSIYLLIAVPFALCLVPEFTR